MVAAEECGGGEGEVVLVREVEEGPVEEEEEEEERGEEEVESEEESEVDEESERSVEDLKVLVVDVASVDVMACRI